jgi:hypothetical protein
VFDAEHPRPPDALNVEELRAAVTRENDVALTELASDPVRFRTVVGEALKVMLHEQAPASAIVVPGTERTFAGDGFVIHQRVLARPGEDKFVPTIELSPSKSPGEDVIIWADPSGSEAMFESGGHTPVAAVRALLAKGISVLSPDVLRIGQSQPPMGHTLPVVKDEARFAGFRNGYNRTLLADRVHDLLTTIAFVRSRSPQPIRLVASGRAGMWGLLAGAIANDDVNGTAIDLAGFDFDSVRRTDDEMLLPGALKYGGVLGVASLFTHGKMALFNPPPRFVLANPRLPSDVVVIKGPQSLQGLFDWIQK